MVNSCLALDGISITSVNWSLFWDVQTLLILLWTNPKEIKNHSNNLMFSFNFPKDKVLKRNAAVFVSHILQQTQTGYLMVTQHVSTRVLREINPSHVKLSWLREIVDGEYWFLNSQIFQEYLKERDWFYLGFGVAVCFLFTLLQIITEI